MAFARSHFRKPATLLLCGALLLTLLGSFYAWMPERSSVPKDRWTTPVRTEQLWVVRSLLNEVARFAALASGRESDLWERDAVQVTGYALQDGRDWYRLRVRHGAGQVWETEISLPDGAWNTAAYVPFTQELLRRARVTLPGAAPAASSRYSSLVALTAPRSELMQRENARISGWLQSSPLDPLAHEEAALLAVTLGWRDASGSFRDPRDLCQRATAHLIFARTLRGHAQSETGAVAELMTGLVGRSSADHEQRLRKLAVRAVASPELQPWITTAELMLGRDWHPVAEANNASLLERIELFRAICKTDGSTAACVQLGRRQFEDVADWPRNFFEHDFSVAEGRRFSRFALPFETDEAVRVFPELAGQPIQSAAFAKALNSPIEPCVTGEGPASARVCVLDAGLWGHFLQRHLCHAIVRTGDHLRATAAVPRTAEAFMQSTAIIFRHLKLIPMAAVYSGDPEWLQSASPAVATLVKQHPDWVSQKIWASFVRQAPAEVTRGLPSVAQWSGEGK